MIIEEEKNDDDYIKKIKQEQEGRLNKATTIGDFLYNGDAFKDKGQYSQEYQTRRAEALIYLTELNNKEIKNGKGTKLHTSDYTIHDLLYSKQNIEINNDKKHFDWLVFPSHSEQRPGLCFEEHESYTYRDFFNYRVKMDIELYKKYTTELENLDTKKSKLHTIRLQKSIQYLNRAMKYAFYEDYYKMLPVAREFIKKIQRFTKDIVKNENYKKDYNELKNMVFNIKEAKTFEINDKGKVYSLNNGGKEVTTKQIHYTHEVKQPSPTVNLNNLKLILSNTDEDNAKKKVKDILNTMFNLPRYGSLTINNIKMMLNVADVNGTFSNLNLESFDYEKVKDFNFTKQTYKLLKKFSAEFQKKCRQRRIFYKTIYDQDNALRIKHVKDLLTDDEIDEALTKRKSFGLLCPNSKLYL